MLALLSLWPFFVLHTLIWNSLECLLRFTIFRNLSSKVTGLVCFSPALAMKVQDPPLYWSFLLLVFSFFLAACVCVVTTSSEWIFLRSSHLGKPVNPMANRHAAWGSCSFSVLSFLIVFLPSTGKYQSKPYNGFLMIFCWFVISSGF